MIVPQWLIWTVVVPDWLAWVLLVIPIFTTWAFGRMTWRAARDLAGKRDTDLPLAEGRLVIGSMCTLFSIANVLTGFSFVNQIGLPTPIVLAAGAIVARGALLPGALYVLFRYRGG